MKGFFIFGQFLVILIGLSVYAPLYRVRRNPEKRFLIPGVQTITKSNEIGAIERITYEISHFNELFYFLVIAVRIILAKGMVFTFFMTDSNCPRFKTDLERCEITTQKLSKVFVSFLCRPVSTRASRQEKLNVFWHRCQAWDQSHVMLDNRPRNPDTTLDRDQEKMKV